MPRKTPPSRKSAPKTDRRDSLKSRAIVFQDDIICTKQSNQATTQVQVWIAHHEAKGHKVSFFIAANCVVWSAYYKPGTSTPGPTDYIESIDSHGEVFLDASGGY